jgi:hypothetical protein
MSSGDELKVPSQRADEHAADQHAEVRTDERDPRDRRDGRVEDSDGRSPGDEGFPRDGRSRGDGGFPGDERFPGHERSPGQVPGAFVRDDEGDDDDGRDELRDRSSRGGDEYAAAGTGAVATPVPGAVAAPEPGDQEGPYRDPYARTDGDMLAEPGLEDGLEDGPGPVRVPAGSEETPAHAAPEEVALFDQDPAQVQARWRDLQVSFVDDPGEAVRRADALVGEVVEALTSSLTSRTNALREHWKDAEAADTERLRLSLRDYRSVLERLLALSSNQGGPQGGGYQSGYQSQESR